MTGMADALSLVFSSLSSGIRPDPIVLPSIWGQDHLVLADGPFAGEKWNPEFTPQFVEILDCLAPENPETEIAVKKSAQVGFTQILTVWLGSIIDVTPARAMVVFPTIASVQDYNRDKLQPTIDASRPLRRRVAQEKNRSSRSSTALSKRFQGGSITLTGANSSADLRSKTVKFAACDEIDDWPLDLDGQGDPMKMVEARQRVFLATGDFKRLKGSTPTIKGMSRIDEEFDAGDQRYWQCKCPQCGKSQRLVFGAKTEYGLKWDTKADDDGHEYRHVYYVCESGCLIEPFHREALIDSGEWVAAAPGPGKKRSYHIDTLTSKSVPWESIVEEFLKCKDDPQKLKGFVNLWLGESWEEKGEAPEYKNLIARRETYPARTIPVGGLVFTCAVDVQKDGVFFEVIAWGQDKQSWSMDVGFIRGDTADTTSEVWSGLTEIYERQYRDAYGNLWPVDLMGVDSGFNTNQVYEWVRRHPKALALKGKAGWGLSPIATSPTDQDVSFDGKKKRRGLKVWHVGTWSLKAELYANLRKEGRKDGAELDPPGFCHFSEGVHDEAYFQQLTAEFIKERVSKGRTVREWVASGPNHYHDCRVYNMALSEHLGISKMTPDEWSYLKKERCHVPEGAQGDMLAAMTALPTESPQREAGDAPVSSSQEEVPAQGEDYFGGHDLENYL